MTEGRAVIVVSSETSVVRRHGMEGDIGAQVVEAIFADLARHATNAGLDWDPVAHFEVLDISSNFDYSGRGFVASDEWLIDDPLVEFAVLPEVNIRSTYANGVSGQLDICCGRRRYRWDSIPVVVDEESTYRKVRALRAVPTVRLSYLPCRGLRPTDCLFRP